MLKEGRFTHEISAFFISLFHELTLNLIFIMNKLLSTTISLFFIILSFSLQAQTGRFYSTDKELSNSLINKVYQDRKGFIWVATENGLNKFDGTHFSIYRHHALDSTSLKNNYVRSLYEDSYGNFWIGCINGLQLYDRATDSFSEIHLQRNEENLAPHITGIIERANGEIWMSTSGQGAISIRVNKDQGKPFDITMESGLSERINSLFLNTIFEDSNQNVWIATEGKGLFRYSSNTGDLKNFRAAQGLTNEDVSSICEDINGNIFVGTLTGGLYVLKRTANNQMEMFTPVPYNNTMTLNIKTLMLDKQGTIYIGTDGEGLKEYNADKNSIVDCQMNAAPFDFSKSKVHSLLQDKDNNLWLGIFQKGIILIPSIVNRFNYFGYKSIQKNTIGSSCVMAIWTDNQGITWIGTDNDGLYGINEHGKQLIHYSHQPNNRASVPGTIMAIYEDSDENLWLGSYFNGLAKMNKRTGHCEYIPQLSVNNSTGVSEKVSCITEDNHRNLWIGTFGSGIQKINLNSHSITQYESTREESNDWKIDRLPNDWINCILKGNNGLLWIGTYKGLSCFDPEKNTFINYMNQNNLLPGYVVSSLLESSDGLIWVGTTEGLFCFNKTLEEFTHFTIDDGLPSDMICGMLEDERGNIWISTHQGLSKMLAKDQTFINYYAADGIQGNEFSRGAMFKDKLGKMYFGGTSGITTFYPKEIIEQKKDMNVIITAMYLANRPIKQGDKSGNNVITESSVMDASEFTLAHNENTFSFEFSTLEFSNPERIIYQYQIDELGNEWSSTYPGTNRVTFTNLNPGKYTFQVRALDQGNLSDTRTISIIITPPWYQTTLATIIWVIITCIFIYGIVMYILSRFRHRQERLEMEHQEQINEAKLQFFINISHEIRTPMTLIISPLEKLIAEGNPEKQSTYLMIYRNAQRILRLINQLMDIRKLDKGQMHLKYRETDIVGFVGDVIQTFDYQAQKKNIRFTFDYKDKELKAWVDLNNFDKVLLNVLSNAFKYTPEGGEIEVKLSTGVNETARSPLKRYFEISVTDNGIGIDKDKIEQIFERFYQINNDLTNSNFGTGIGLHLSRSLVELHKGVIKAENREDGVGTRFIIRLPMGSDHLKTEDLENPEEMIEKNIILERPKSPIPENLIDQEQNSQKKARARTRYKVLVIEDDDEIRNYISAELSSFFRISESANGKDGWEMILKEKPDLIISDVMMPEMDGITLSKKVKQNVNINHIPIILLTAKSKAEDKIEGLETGADAYIVKPFNSELLKTTVHNLIDNRERLKNRFSNEKEVDEKIVKIERKSNDEVLMEKIMRTINEHLDDPALNVEMLAANAGMSRVHMHRKLKELTNQSARDFIRNIRLKQAATLLTDKRLTVSEVAYATGFSNISHFSSSFKELYGVSPTEYKERQ